ncbi:MAG: hypothetical protein ACT4OE_04170 [Sphingosinicella sp.]
MRATIGLLYSPAMRWIVSFLAMLLAAPLAAQELPEGQGEAEYRAWLDSSPGVRAQVLGFEYWQDVAGVRGVLPTWQLLRTASMWRECGGPPFEVPPHQFWPDMVRTLRFIRDHVRPALGPVEAVSGYRNPVLNQCARGSARSAHLDFFALDLVPLFAIDRLELFRRLCPLHARIGPAVESGLGFYAFVRFHVDTRGFRRWGAAGPAGNESPCAVLERGGDPLAPPIPIVDLVPPPPPLDPAPPTR